MPDYRIIVDLSDHMLYLLDGNQVIKGYPVATGKMLTQTPNGEFTIINKQSNPGGPFGVLWMGLSRTRSNNRNTIAILHRNFFRIRNVSRLLHILYGRFY